MKKVNAMLIMSAIILTSAAVFSGCSANKNSEDSSAAESSSAVSEESLASETEVSKAQETQPDPLAPTEPAETTAAATAAVTERETSSAEPAEKKYETDENGAVIFADSSSATSGELILAAQELFEAACKTSWDFHVGCPYELDYNSTVKNDYSWEFYLVTDEGINSIADVEADYFKVFSESYGSDLSEIYMESNGRVYALNGARGQNLYYTGSAVTAVESRTENEIFFTVENYYSGDDFSGEGNITKSAVFSAVISPDGSWRAGKFSLPY